jgi:hypothetical protein
MNNVNDIIRVIFFQKLENSKFNASLVIILLFIFYHFKCCLLPRHMVQTFKGRSKTTLTQKRNNLKPVPNMISIRHHKVTLGIIVAEIVTI